MKYIDWLKRQIKLCQFKNVIWFAVEKRLNQIEEEKKKKKPKEDSIWSFRHFW